MLRKVTTVVAVALGSAFVVILTYPLLGLLGAGFAFLAPGLYLAPLVPEQLLSRVEPGPVGGALILFSLSFLTWWLICCMAGCIYFLRRRVGNVGA